MPLLLLLVLASVHVGLWFHARERVIGALLKRGLIVADGGYTLTAAGVAALQAHGDDD